MCESLKGTPLPSMVSASACGAHLGFFFLFLCVWGVLPLPAEHGNGPCMVLPHLVYGQEVFTVQNKSAGGWVGGWGVGNQKISPNMARLWCCPTWSIANKFSQSKRVHTRSNGLVYSDGCQTPGPMTRGPCFMVHSNGSNHGPHHMFQSTGAQYIVSTGAQLRLAQV